MNTLIEHDGVVPKESLQLSRRQIEATGGLTAGCITTLVTHPLDLIKIRLQLSHSHPRGTSHRAFEPILNIFKKINEDALQDFKKTQKLSGPSQLKKFRLTHLLRHYYRGITPNLVGNISAWGLYFTLYSEFKSLEFTSNPSVNYFSSSTLAGMSTSLLTNPLWVLKTRILGSSKNDSKAYKSIADGVVSILRKEGVLSFWRGSIPSLFSVFQGSLQFTFYDNYKNFISKRYETEQLTTAQYIYGSAFSKIFSMLIMYPTQVVRSILQNYQGDSKQERTIRSVARHLWKEDGPRGFYKGLSANILRVVPATCVTFVVYETVRDNLRKYETRE
ncbi:hypothetical protein G9P44_003230 [Scheffersomyces stipitis]|nr:hypothetical protein G9P44_003230 [Scheffersomyces stipitis]